MARFFAGVLVAPLLLTLLYRATPISWPLWVPDLVLLALVAMVTFVLHWKHVAVGMLISGLLWIGFTLWLTAKVSPDW